MSKRGKPTVPRASAAIGPRDRGDSTVGPAFPWSLAVLATLGLAGAGVVYWVNRPVPPRPSAATPAERSEIPQNPPPIIPLLPFTDITEEAGVDFVHENGAYGDKLLPETMGGGCAFFDFDNDGDQDLLLINGKRWDWDPRPNNGPALQALYENDGAGRFRNVTAGSGLDVSLYGMGVAVGDYDNDGRVDVFISALGPNRLFRNVGGKFVEVTETAGVAGDSNAWSTSCGWFDYDNDGDLDLFVCNYLEWSKDFDLGQRFQLIGGGRAYGRPQVFRGAYPYLYRNEGGGKFVDVAAEAGLHIDNSIRNEPLAKSLGLAPADFDGDGWIDLIVANDTVQNLLFHNQGNGTFAEIGAAAGVAFDSSGNARGAMGIDTSQFRNNGQFGVAIGNFSNEMTALYVSQGSNLLFLDEAIPAGIGHTTRLELTFGVFFFDCDLDGRLDLFAANGHLEEDIQKVQAYQSYEQAPQLFWNAGIQAPTEFLSVPTENYGSDFTRPMVGRGAAYADIDGDGDQDILIAATGQQPRLLRNDQRLNRHWLRVKLVGTRSNRDGIGSWVEVHEGNRILRRQVMPTRSYLSQVELPVTFGLGDVAEVHKIVVRWSDGTVQEIASPDSDQFADRLIEIVQPQSP